MGVVLVGQMVASTDCLKKVEENLKQQNVKVASFLANGQSFKNSAEEITEAVKTAGVLLTGMASPENLAREEIIAAETAAEMKIPFGFYADTYSVINRPWFAHLREKASFVFVINEEEAETACGLFPNAEVLVSGNPNWERFFYSKLSREDVRRSLRVGKDDYMVLCPGGRNLVVNVLHWGAVIEALNSCMTPNYWKIFLSMHPGDQNNPNVYADLAKYSVAPVRIMTKDMMSTSDILPGCDLVIESASTIGIEAVCKRKPVIDYFSEIALARLEEMGGSRDWPPCKMGIATEVKGDSNKLFNAVLDLLLHGGADKMRRRQEQVYPETCRMFGSIHCMVETLIKYAKK